MISVLQTIMKIKYIGKDSYINNAIDKHENVEKIQKPRANRSKIKHDL